MVFSRPDSSVACVRPASTGGRSTMPSDPQNPPIERHRAYQYLRLIELLLTVVALVTWLAISLGLV